MTKPVDPQKISPSALFTSYIWSRHRLSPAQMKTGLGLWYYLWMQPVEWIAKLTGQITLEEMLVTRHRAIDQLIHRHLSNDRDYQVVELAAGLSSRGLRILQSSRAPSQAGPSLTYVEGDLTGIIQRKSALFSANHWHSPNHHLVAFDLLAPDSYDAIKAKLSPNLKTLIIAEGILSYFSPPAVASILTQCQQLIAMTAGGHLICDAHFSEEVTGVRGSKLFQKLQTNFVKSPMKLPWNNAQEARTMLNQNGFGVVNIYQAYELLDSARRRDGVVRIVEGSIK